MSAAARPPDAVDVEHVRKVLALLSDRRWDDRALWVNYGIALWRLAGDKLKAAWKERSQSYAQYDEQAADTAWASFGKGTFTGRPVTFGTICHYAKEDDPAGYAKVQAEFAGDKVGRAVNFALQTGGSHVAVAKVLHAVLGADYRATSASAPRAWFCFDGTRWRKHDDGQVLRDITERVQPVFHAKEQQLATQVAAAAGDTKEQLEKARARCSRIANQLLNSSFRSSVIREFAPLVQDPGFEAKLDSNVNLLGFEDGVYDLAAGELRPGRPTDCLTKSVRYCFPRESHGYEAEVFEFVRQILPDPELRNYLLDLLAQKLCGACVKRVCIHVGVGGDNGKTTLFECALQVLGDYGYKGKIQMLCAKRQEAGRADPDSAMLRGIRLLFAEEPDEGARLNINLLKDWSGGGALSFRLLFSNEVVSTVPQFMVHLACNKMLEVDGSDGGGHNPSQQVRLQL